MQEGNRQWRLVSYPEGMPAETNWALSDGVIPEARTNELVARAIYLDVAPYMRGRISPQKNYAAGVKPGDVMLGGGIGEVMQSNAKQFKPGDIVKWKPIDRPAYDAAVADVEAGRFSPILRDVSFSLTEFNRDIDGYNRKLEGVLHGH